MPESFLRAIWTAFGLPRLPLGNFTVGCRFRLCLLEVAYSEVSLKQRAASRAKLKCRLFCRILSADREC